MDRSYIENLERAEGLNQQAMKESYQMSVPFTVVHDRTIKDAKILAQLPWERSSPISLLPAYERYRYTYQPTESLVRDARKIRKNGQKRANTVSQWFFGDLRAATSPSRNSGQLRSNYALYHAKFSPPPESNADILDSMECIAAFSLGMASSNGELAMPLKDGSFHLANLVVAYHLVHNPNENLWMSSFPDRLINFSPDSGEGIVLIVDNQSEEPGELKEPTTLTGSFHPVWQSESILIKNTETAIVLSGGKFLAEIRNQLFEGRKLKSGYSGLLQDIFSDIVGDVSKVIFASDERQLAALAQSIKSKIEPDDNLVVTAIAPSCFVQA